MTPLERYRQFRSWLFSPRAIDSLRCALLFCTGTLFCMIPGYPTLWSTGLALADQISFTLLGGVSKPVGGCWEQLFNRLGGGITLGTPCYVLLALLGKQYTVQGVLMAIFIFLLSWIGSRSSFVGGGALFAQTACIYAVTNSYRQPGAFHLHLTSLWDLLKCWVFGAAMCLAYNMFFFPKFASKELMRHTDSSLVNIQQAVDFLYSDEVVNVDPQELNAKLTADIDTSATLLRQASWEITHQSANTKDLRAMVEALDRLRIMLSTCILDRCAYRMLKGETASMLREPVRNCHRAYTNLIKGVRAGVEGRIESGTDSTATLRLAQTAFAAASADLTDEMLHKLSKLTETDVKSLSHLYVATHCISIAGPLAERLEALYTSVAAFASRPRHWQIRFLEGAFSLKTYMPSAGVIELLLGSAENKNPFLPAPSLAQRIMRMFTTDQAISALKIVIALCAMMSILWADESRDWFLQHNIQTATVPLILALMPTLGGSILAWIAELLGTFSGAVWGFVTMLVWRNVHGAAFSVPGVTFFQLLYALCLSWRLAWECDDMLAVLGCFALGAYINKEFQLRHSQPPQSLAEQLGTSCITICIAVGIAIPMQFLVIRKNARQTCRLALADSMREVGEVHESVGKLFSLLLLDDKLDEATVSAEAAALRATTAKCRRQLLSLRAFVKEAQAEIATHDGWLASRFVRQIAACQTMLATSDICARILSEGPFDQRVLRLISPEFATAAAEFSGSTSSVLWCHAAALSLLRPLPGTLPAVEDTMRSVLVEVERASKKAVLLDASAARVESDLRRFWQLSHLLLSQGSTLALLEKLLSVDWRPELEDGNSKDAELSVEPKGDEQFMRQTSSSAVVDVEAMVPVLKQ